MKNFLAGLGIFNVEDIARIYLYLGIFYKIMYVLKQFVNLGIATKAYICTGFVTHPFDKVVCALVA